MNGSQVLIDTDPGIDDAMALLFLRAAPGLRIRGITTVFGNADVETTTRNAVYIARRFGIDAPVFGGAARPLNIERLAAPVHVHGSDGLGDLATTSTEMDAPGTGRAHERIVEVIRTFPNEVSILALGPLTNLALALRHDPGIAALVPRVVIMGGAFGWRGPRGNISPVAEANIRNDPHAANEVLSARWPVTMVGLDVTSQCVLSTEQARSLASDAAQTGQFLWDISRHYEALYRAHGGLEGCCLHDVAAAACLLDPRLFATRFGPIRVRTDGAAIGQTIQHPGGAPHLPPAWENVPPQRACNDVDAERLIRMYTTTLISHAR